MRLMRLALVPVALVVAFSAVPASAVAQQVKVNSSCSPGYRERSAVTVEGNTIRFCTN